MATAIYRTLIKIADKFVPQTFQPLWNHEAGPKTIFFWAPAFKWGLVIAGIGDIYSRPIEKLSIPQSSSLAVTGLIWSRYSMVIIPKNYSLLSVNAFVALINTIQLGRAFMYQNSLQKSQK
ncbi:mitochondrial pyruvate carrier 2-like [Nilaparvata lugens]|uniref:mitochondrial pyruvate carrier 2-like n=1 Tax=Nilaparvata lugens TaxID=108931 RepID=UPI00193D5B21|nr:mitochondrial pyruvate carrier 2-like [Nilaparvata lugens]